MQTSRLVVCEGGTMVSDAECEEKAIAWCKLIDGSVNFTLDEEMEVSLGIIVNLTGQASFGINAFKLEGVTIEPLIPTGLSDLKESKDSKDLRNLKDGIYDLSGRRISAEANSSFFSDSLEQRRALKARSTLHSSLKKGIYIMNGNKVVIK